MSKLEPLPLKKHSYLITFFKQGREMPQAPENGRPPQGYVPRKRLVTLGL